MRMVADAAGVSKATVSYVLAGKASNVSEVTKERVLAAATSLDYRPDRLARAMRTGRTGIVQLSLRMLADPWSLAVSSAVNEAAVAEDLAALILADGDWSKALDRLEPDVAYIDSPDANGDAAAQLATLARRGQRLVVFSEHLEPDGFDVIRSNSLPGADLAVAHLLELTDDIACITSRGQASSRDSGRRTRLSSYSDRVADGSIRSDRTATYSLTQADAFRAAVTVLTAPHLPRAVFCTTDFAALATIQAAQMLGIDVPGDLLVTGLGNTPSGLTSTPTLTTAGPRDFYRRQADVIIAAATNDVVGSGTVHEFAWHLIPRASTDASTHSTEGRRIS